MAKDSALIKMDTMKHFHASDLFKIDDIEHFHSNDLEALLHKILQYVRHITNSDAGTIYLAEDDYLKFHIFQNDSLPYETILDLQESLKDLRYQIKKDTGTIAVESFIQSKVISVFDIYQNKKYDFKSSKEFDKNFSYKTKSILTAPLVNFYTNSSIGVLQLINKKAENGQYIAYTEQDKEFISLSSYLITQSILNTKNSIEKLELLNKELEKKVIERTKKLKDTQKKLIEQANRDPMTNLYNRRYFNEIIKSLLLIAKRTSQLFSLIIIDIDDFKNVNDTYGHSVGDRVINDLADIFRNTVRNSDISVRFGGEEFVIILPNTHLKEAEIIAKKLKDIVENNTIILKDGSRIKFTISLGVSQIQQDDESVETVLHKADEALYQAKNSGKNTIVIKS
jgi:diguanylate cyclase (GGDEF)-like protein